MTAITTEGVGCLVERKGSEGAVAIGVSNCLRFAQDYPRNGWHGSSGRSLGLALRG
jgi:hypothetical protein